MTRVASLLVHTEPRTAALTALNIREMLGAECVAVHVSTSADFEPGELEALLRKHDQVVINPTRCSLAWGRIIEGHLANFRLLARLGFPESTPTFLHASNDWYLREAPHDLHDWGAQQRTALGSTSLWAHTRRSVASLRSWGDIIGAEPQLSQCEGSWFPLRWAIETIEQGLRDVPEVHALPAEEYLLPTAAAQLPSPGAAPLIFSEVTRKDVIVGNSPASLLSALPQPLAYGALRAVHAAALRRPTMWALTAADLDQIRRTGQAPTARHVREGRRPWVSYSGVVGAKRIPLAREHPLRVLAEDRAH